MRLSYRFFLMVLIGSILVNASLFWRVAGPKKKEVIEREAEYQDIRRRLLNVRNRLRNEKYFKEGFANVKKDLEKFNSVLPQQEEVTKLIQELSGIAEKSGVRVSGVRYEPFVREEGYNRLSFSFPVEGRYSNIRKFIYEIETIREIIWIERLNLKASYQGPEDVLIRLTMATYFI